MSTPELRIPPHVREAATRINTELPLRTVLHALTMYDAGWPPRRIAADLGLGVQQFYKWRRKSGLPLNGSQGRNTTVPEAEIDLTARLYLAGLTTREVGGRLGCSEGEVRRRLVRAGVQRRPQGFRQGRMRPVAPDGWETAEQAGERLGFSRAYVTELSAAGRIPGARRGRWKNRPVWLIPAGAVPMPRAGGAADTTHLDQEVTS
ncbi:MAG: helix-turn-helix domain-containing protein [Solirubrobacteraceae bacterium]